MSKDSCCKWAFTSWKGKKGKELGERERGGGATWFINHNSALCLGKQELNQEAWYDKGYNVVCQWVVISKKAWYSLGGCPRKGGEKFSRRPTGPSENYTMHKVGLQAMQEQSWAFQDYLFWSCWMGELPLKGLRGANWRVGPRLEGGVQAVGPPALRQNEMQRSSLGSRANMEERAKN